MTQAPSGLSDYISPATIKDTGEYTVAVTSRKTGSFTLTVKGRIPWLGGHQQDHTVKYKIGAAQPIRASAQPSNPVDDPATVIPSAISTAAAKWNQAVRFSLPRVLFCKDDSGGGNSNECSIGGREKNTDGKDVRINVARGLP